MTSYQSEDPSPTLPTYTGKEEKGKIVEDKKGETCIGPALETGQSNTMKQKEGSTMKKLSRNSLQLGDKLKELLNRKKAIKN